MKRYWSESGSGRVNCLKKIAVCNPGSDQADGLILQDVVFNKGLFRAVSRLFCGQNGGLSEREGRETILAAMNRLVSRSRELMKPLLKHVVIPALAPVALIALYFTPKEVFGCANRGFMALGVVLLAAIAALVTTVKGTAAQRRGSKESIWWLVSTLILISAVVLLLGPLR
jgi:hypothetical protein